MHKPSRIHQRSTRMHQASLALCLGVLLLLLGHTVYGSARACLAEWISPMPRHIISYRASSGDTLWDIAAKNIAQGEDIREKIIDIRRLNDLKPNEALQPGQLVQSPVKTIRDGDFRYTVKFP